MNDLRRFLEKQPQPLLVWLGCLFVLSLYLRTAEISHIPGINGDEAFPAVEMLRAADGQEVVLLTPTKRLMSPIYCGIVVIVNKVMRQVSVPILRSPAAMAGVGALLIALLLFPSVLGARRALMACLLLAASPLAIAYSRSAVEQAFSPIAGVFVFYFVFQRRWFPALVSLFFASLCHPLNMFLTPMVVAPLLTAIWTERGATLTERRWRTAGIVLAFGTLIQLHLALAGKVTVAGVPMPTADAPLAALALAGKFLYEAARVIAGGTVYQYFASRLETPFDEASSVAVLFSGLALIAFGGRALWRKRKWFELSFLAGIGLAVLGLFLGGGDLVVSVGENRHGTLLLIPTAIAGAILLEACLAHFAEREILYGAATFATLSMALFSYGYFGEIYRTGGGTSHPTYLTGAAEPKVAALKWATEDAQQNPAYDANSTLQIVVEDWWLYWPLKYLAYPLLNVEVLSVAKDTPKDIIQGAFNTGAYFVGYSGYKFDNYLKEVYGGRLADKVIKHEIESYSPDRHLNVWRLKDVDRTQITRIEKLPHPSR